MTIKLEIDGKPVEVDNGATVMEAANKLGTFVPHFCYHKKLSIAANCRMCLVQVEKAPKPLPACATPATEGMKVWTQSAPAVAAQKGVMEFLLINHPLDCPICDQGGECQLQDLAVGYGGSCSRYEEEKRVVVNKNLGPLIATDMTRCIHCTRCVRFGQEIAGVMELGMAGRGEHSEILTFVGRTVDSELSGNMIDLCPVGALTSKPFRYSARTWELARRKSVSPHDGLGSSLVMQVKQERVMRVVPLENEAVNECWLSDRDRFAYEGLNTEDRLTRPMVCKDGAWVEVDWPEALEAVATGLRDTVARHGPASLAALLSPTLTLEELHLATKLARGLGSDNVDHHFRALDSRARFAGAPWLGMPVAELGRQQAVLLVGSTIRKEQPLIAQRLRQGARKGLAVSVVHVADDDLLMPVAHRLVARPSGSSPRSPRWRWRLPSRRGAPSKARSPRPWRGSPPPTRRAPSRRAFRDASAPPCSLGHYAQQHPEFAALAAIAREIARLAGATFGVLAQNANSVGAKLVGAHPLAGGLDTRGMLAHPPQGLGRGRLRAGTRCGAGPGRDRGARAGGIRGRAHRLALLGARVRARDPAHRAVGRDRGHLREHGRPRAVVPRGDEAARRHPPRLEGAAHAGLDAGARRDSTRTPSRRCAPPSRPTCRRGRGRGFPTTPRPSPSRWPRRARAWSAWPSGRCTAPTRRCAARPACRRRRTRRPPPGRA